MILPMDLPLLKQRFCLRSPGPNQTSSYRKTWIQKETLIKSNSLFWGNFGLSFFWCKEQNQQFFTTLVWHNLKAIDWELQRTNQACSEGETKDLISETFRKHWFFKAVPVNQDSDATNKNKDFQMTYPCSSRLLSIEILLKELNFVFFWAKLSCRFEELQYFFRF